MTSEQFIKEYSIVFFDFMILDLVKSLRAERSVKDLDAFFQIISIYYIGNIYKSPRIPMNESFEVFKGLKNIVKSSFEDCYDLLKLPEINEMRMRLSNCPLSVFKRFFVDDAHINPVIMSLVDLFESYNFLLKQSKVISKSVMLEFYVAFMHVISTLLLESQLKKDASEVKENQKVAAVHLEAAARNIYKVMINVYFHVLAGELKNSEEDKLYVRMCVEDISNFTSTERQDKSTHNYRSLAHTIYHRYVFSEPSNLENIRLYLDAYAED